MCGRFTQTKTREEVLAELADNELPPLFHRRYNIAPTQSVAVISETLNKPVETHGWGFENPQSGAPIINARIETLHERPMFRDLVSDGRCLIPADGFYEWKSRQPYYFQLPDRRLFAFAGLRRSGKVVIVTRAADENMQGIHDRMPVILEPSSWPAWLEQFHQPDPPSLTTRPVSMRVNKVANDDPACLDPGEVQTDLSLFPDEG
jgi:putative SOS response-associated peptidase YedK